MNQLWFKRKTYGYGWTPATKEGWMVIGVYALCIIAAGMYFMSGTPSLRETVLFALSVMCASAVLIVVCVKKGEIPRWQWGEHGNTRETDLR